MSATLTFVEAAANKARFYKLDIQPTLFGEWSVIAEWGRIGRAGTVRAATYPTKDEAVRALTAKRAQKLRKGYGAPLHDRMA